MRKTYPSDVTREQFEKIRPILESARKKTKPRTLDLYDVFCAILYLLKSGCQWDMLPSDLPKRSSVHAYFTIWKAARVDEHGNPGPSILEEVLKKIGWRGPFVQWSERDHQFSHH
jgi:transposase